MRRIDVFNGDADGLCALRQLRLAEPAEAELVTGVKRDIALLARVEAQAGDRVTVLDVSMDRNRAALLPLLERGVHVRWFDHHYAGEVPSHPQFEPHLKSARGVCTSLLVDRHVGGRFAAWAVTGAFGDGMDRAAAERGAAAGLGEADLALLRELGRDLNYNAYGETEADLLLPPAALYRHLCEFPDPRELAAGKGLGADLRARRLADLALAEAVLPRWRGENAEILLLPAAAWSRRVIGSFAHLRAGADPRRAIAVLAPTRSGALTVSLRVPEGASLAADAFCRGFPGGGGRREAGGIDGLPAAGVDDFERRFREAYG